MEMGAKELSRVDGYLPLHERHHIHFYRQSCCTDHFMLVLVVDDQVVYDDTVKNADIYSSDADLSAQKVADDTCHLLTDEALRHRQSCNTEEKNVQRDNCP